MSKDLRLYAYASGTLRKWPNSNKEHKHETIESAVAMIKRMQHRRWFPKQIAIVEYTEVYSNNHIVGIYQNGALILLNLQYEEG